MMQKKYIYLHLLLFLFSVLNTFDMKRTHSLSQEQKRDNRDLFEGTSH